MFQKMRSPYNFASLIPEAEVVGLPTPLVKTSSVKSRDLNTTPSTPDFFQLLGKCPLSAERQELLSRLASVIGDIQAFLAEHKATQKAALGIAHDECVATVRDLAGKLADAKTEEAEAENRYEALAQASKNADALARGAKHQFENSNLDLHTRKEIAQSQAFINRLRSEAGEAQRLASGALTEYRQALQASAEAAAVHQQAVSHATSISRQLNSL
jgi:hypothetical protein